MEYGTVKVYITTPCTVGKIHVQYNVGPFKEIKL